MEGAGLMTLDNFTEEVAAIIGRTLNWKASGPDGVHNFWLKRFTAVHAPLTAAINRVLKQPAEMPLFLVQGMTYLLPKGERSANPAKYRPITCLPTLYKVITACVAERIRHHCEINNVILEQQKGCAKNSRGCKEQLVIW